MDALTGESLESFRMVMLLAGVSFVGLTGYCVWYSRMVGRMSPEQREAHSYLCWPVIIVLASTIAILYMGFLVCNDLLFW